MTHSGIGETSTCVHRAVQHAKAPIAFGVQFTAALTTQLSQSDSAHVCLTLGCKRENMCRAHVVE
jgi:hypothetical protein